MDTEQRAIRARQLREDVIFREVMDGLRDNAIKSWAQTKVEDEKQRFASWMMVKVLNNIEVHLQSIEDEQAVTLWRSVRAPQ